MTTVTLTGWKEFEDKLKRLPKQLQEEVGGEVEDAGRLWASLAKRDAPKDQGFLAGQISSNYSQGVAEVTSPALYSAYVEWGTKTRVRVPAELSTYASQFRGGGNTGAKKMIYAWMKRVGVPPEFYWIVFYSIITKGINPHPYFFVQIPIVEKQLFTNVQKILNTEH